MNPEQVTVFAYLEVTPGSEAEFLQHAAAVIAATRTETACINYDLHQSSDAPRHFAFYENWTSLVGLQQHAASAHIAAFRAAITGLLAQPTEIKIYRMVSAPAA